jgi:hypothetical protein
MALFMFLSPRQIYQHWLLPQGGLGSCCLDGLGDEAVYCNDKPTTLGPGCSQSCSAREGFDACYAWEAESACRVVLCRGVTSQWSCRVSILLAPDRRTC